MPQVDYEHQLPYLPPEEGGVAFPGVWVSFPSPVNGGESVEVQAHIDTGAEYSVFNGWIATAIGLILLDGEPILLAATSGAGLDARFHHVQVVHETLGNFPLRVAFSLSDIRRNLLGRDFLSLIQIGFRESHLSFYVTPEP